MSIRSDDLTISLNGLGNRLIDRRTVTGRAPAKWRLELIQDLGGDDAISTQQIELVDLAVKSKLSLDSIDSWLLTQATLINARKRTLIPVLILVLANDSEQSLARACSTRWKASSITTPS